MHVVFLFHRPLYTTSTCLHSFQSIIIHKQPSISLKHPLFSLYKKSKSIKNFPKNITEMEQNLPVITKKVWNVVRTILYLLRKGIPKGKLMAELNLIFKRWKLAGKAIQNLMFHHTHHRSASSSSATTSGRGSPLESTNESEFSCSKSPAYPNFHLPFHLNKRKPNSHRATEEDLMTLKETLEKFYSAAASPAFPGFGKSARVRQLRVTDSPFPLRGADEDNHVDEAAEEFIMKFYSELRRQIEMATPRRGS